MRGLARPIGSMDHLVQQHFVSRRLDLGIDQNIRQPTNAVVGRGSGLYCGSEFKTGAVRVISLSLAKYDWNAAAVRDGVVGQSTYCSRISRSIEDGASVG